MHHVEFSAISNKRCYLPMFFYKRKCSLFHINLDPSAFMKFYLSCLFGGSIFQGRVKIGCDIHLLIHRAVTSKKSFPSKGGDCYYVLINYIHNIFKHIGNVVIFHILF